MNEHAIKRSMKADGYSDEYIERITDDLADYRLQEQRDDESAALLERKKTMKTSELTGAALDWAVAKCEGKFNEDGDYWADPEGIWYFLTARNNPSEGLPWTNGSTDWAQVGPIIQREKITLEWTGEDWMGYIRHDEEFFGSTPLIAAMRCYVASRLGNEIEVPDELMEAA